MYYDLEAVNFVKTLNPWVHCAFGNAFFYEQSNYMHFASYWKFLIAHTNISCPFILKVLQILEVFAELPCHLVLEIAQWVNHLLTEGSWNMCSEKSNVQHLALLCVPCLRPLYCAINPGVEVSEKKKSEAFFWTIKSYFCDCNVSKYFLQKNF